MPRTKKAAPDPELVVEENATEAVTTPETTPPEPSCSECHTPFTWRDHAYGAAARGLCRTHDQKRQRAALRGSYVTLQTTQGPQPDIAKGTSRKQRRDHQFGRTPKQTLRQPMRRAA